MKGPNKHSKHKKNTKKHPTFMKETFTTFWITEDIALSLNGFLKMFQVIASVLGRVPGHSANVLPQKTLL